MSHSLQIHIFIIFYHAHTEKLLSINTYRNPKTFQILCTNSRKDKKVPFSQSLDSSNVKTIKVSTFTEEEQTTLISIEFCRVNLAS